MTERVFEGRVFRKATASNGGGGCVYLPSDGELDAVADSKTGVVLTVPADGLVAFAKGVAR
jgi:Domain of unknown function (DUF397)